jgi:LPXTG-site transpeptidase (sortase) family protein
MTLKRFNNILSLIILILAIYLILFPFLPGIWLTFSNFFDKNHGQVYQSKLAQNEDPNLKDLKSIPKDNRLVIPKIKMNGLIHEGANSSVLKLGMWRRPKTSTPEKGGNTVIISHRRMYTFNPDIFYNLDKLAVGDKFMIFWQGKEYDYQVFEATVVKPTQSIIEANTEDPIVTLYTCTLDSKSRIVVKAKLIEL